MLEDAREQAARADLGRSAAERAGARAACSISADSSTSGCSGRRPSSAQQIAALARPRPAAATEAESRPPLISTPSCGSSSGSRAPTARVSAAAQLLRQRGSRPRLRLGEAWPPVGALGAARGGRAAASLPGSRRVIALIERAAVPGRALIASQCATLDRVRRRARGRRASRWVISAGEGERARRPSCRYTQRTPERVAGEQPLAVRLIPDQQREVPAQALKQSRPETPVGASDQGLARLRRVKSRAGRSARRRLVRNPSSRTSGRVSVGAGPVNATASAPRRTTRALSAREATRQALLGRSAPWGQRRRRTAASSDASEPARGSRRPGGPGHSPDRS